MSRFIFAKKHFLPPYSNVKVLSRNWRLFDCTGYIVWFIALLSDEAKKIFNCNLSIILKSVHDATQMLS